MKSSWYLGLGLSLAVLLTGCSSGGGGGSDDDDAASDSPDSTAKAGLYLGEIVQGQNSADSTLLLSVDADGTARIIEEASGTYAKGNLQFSDTGSFEGSIEEFVAGELAESGTIKGTSTTNSFSGTSFDDAGTQFNSFQFDRVPQLSDLSTSTAKVQGNWASDDTTIAIDSAGAFSGGDGKCSIAGQLAVPDKSINLYDLTFNLSGGAACEHPGAYDGFAYYAPASGSDPIQLVFLADNNDFSRKEVFVKQ